MRGGFDEARQMAGLIGPHHRDGRLYSPASPAHSRNASAISPVPLRSFPLISRLSRPNPASHIASTNDKPNFNHLIFNKFKHQMLNYIKMFKKGAPDAILGAVTLMRECERHDH